MKVNDIFPRKCASLWVFNTSRLPIHYGHKNWTIYWTSSSIRGWSLGGTAAGMIPEKSCSLSASDIKEPVCKQNEKDHRRTIRGQVNDILWGTRCVRANVRDHCKATPTATCVSMDDGLTEWYKPLRQNIVVLTMIASQRNKSYGKQLHDLALFPPQTPMGV